MNKKGLEGIPLVAMIIFVVLIIVLIFIAGGGYAKLKDFLANLFSGMRGGG